MKTFKQYFEEAVSGLPKIGDVVVFTVNDQLLCESTVMAIYQDGVLLTLPKSVQEFLENSENYLTEAEYQGRTVTLNQPHRTPGGPKKFSVYVKNPKTGNVKKVNFGDRKMEIKRDDPKRRKSFRARHGCDTSKAKDKTTAKYWSCKMWQAGKSVSDMTS